MATAKSRRKRRARVQTKIPIRPMSDDRRLEVVAQLTDDVLAKPTHAFFEVARSEGWGKRDLAVISGIDETNIGHILAGRRKNITVETIALLSRAMRTRPELVLHDQRPKNNNLGRFSSAAAALELKQLPQPGMNEGQYLGRSATFPNLALAE